MYSLTVSQPPYMNQYCWTQIKVLASPSFWWLYHSLKEVKVLVTQSCLTLCHPWTIAHQLLCPWDFPGKNVGVGCYSLLQGIFLTQGLNLGLLHCRQILYIWLTRETHSLIYGQITPVFKVSIFKFSRPAFSNLSVFMLLSLLCVSTASHL